MREETLNLLRCQNRLETEELCLSPLKKVDNILKCVECEKEYEIKRGIPVMRESYLFNWDNVPGNDSEKLLRFFRDDLDIDWAENAEIRKSDDGKIIRIFKDENSAEIIIDEKKEKAILKIRDCKTHDLKVKEENGKLNIYPESPTDRYESEWYLNIYCDAHFSKYIELPSFDTFTPCGLTEGFYQIIIGHCVPYLNKKSHILDLGCATGRLSLELAKYSQYVIGLDWSMRLVDNALKIVCSNEKIAVRINDIGEKRVEGQLRGFGMENCDFIAGDAQNIPFDNSTFDLVLNVNLIDVVPEPDRMIDEAHRVLKTNGLLVITDPLYWGEERSETRFWKDDLSDFLSEDKWEIKSETDGILFALRYYSRFAQVFYNQLVIAEKK